MRVRRKIRIKIRIKISTINTNINDDKYFQYEITVAFNHKQIKSYPERISNIKPFINQYDWKK